MFCISSSPRRLLPALATVAIVQATAFGAAADVTRPGSFDVLFADGEAFDLYIPYTFAQTVWEWLLEAAAEFGYRVDG